MKKPLLTFLICLLTFHLWGQIYTTSKVHSHNDYENKVPFWLAYSQGFGSIEADIWLVGNHLYVGHDTIEIKMKRSLEDFYLKPIYQSIQKNNGHIYSNPVKRLQLLIDVKTDSILTLKKLVQVLRKYPSLIKNPSLKFTISGNRPPVKNYKNYPSFILFDGRLDQNYRKDELRKVGLISDDFSNYTSWNGQSPISPEEETKLESLVLKAHAYHKKIRFWAVPDSPLTWNEMMKLKVDYINTDSIVQIANYLKIHSQYRP